MCWSSAAPEFEPYRTTVELPAKGRVEVEIPLRRWYSPQEDAWYPGNTHIHYDEKETRPDERLGIDCSVEGYNVTCVSVLDRRQLPYASNKYPIGVMNEFTTAHHVLDIGEENRHYGDNSPWGFGYGHVMLLNIRNLVQPISRGHTLARTIRPGLPALVLLLRRRPRTGRLGHLVPQRPRHGGPGGRGAR